MALTHDAKAGPTFALPTDDSRWQTMSVDEIAAEFQRDAGIDARAARRIARRIKGEHGGVRFLEHRSRDDSEAA